MQKNISPFTHLAWHGIVQATLVVKKGEEYSVEITGDDELVRDTKVELPGDNPSNLTRLEIRCPKKSGSNIFIGNCIGSIVIINDVVISGGTNTGSTSPKLDVTVTIPHGANIDLIETLGSGEATTERDVFVKTANIVQNGPGKVEISSVENLTVDNCGSGDVLVGNISGGTLSISNKSIGKTEIKSGAVNATEVNIESTGSGNVKIGAPIRAKCCSIIAESIGKISLQAGLFLADCLEVESSGSGNIEFYEQVRSMNSVNVKQESIGKVSFEKGFQAKTCSIKNSGSGDCTADGEVFADESTVRMKSIGSVKFRHSTSTIGNLRLTVSGSGDFKFSGSVNDAGIELTSIGSAKIAQCTKHTVSRKGSGSLKIG